MKIGILQTGDVPPELEAAHGTYPDMFERLLAGHGFKFQTWRALDGVIPETPSAADGWLITGSRHGVYEDHAWIAPLEAFIRQCYADGVPMVGVCFGHQIIAQALGGQVAKFGGGWGVGAQEYSGDQRVLAFHQDQVLTPPAEATTTMSSDFCEHAMLVYGDRALSVQPHPEFTPDFVEDLLEARGAILPDGLADQAKGALRTSPLTSARYGDMFAEFFTRAR